MNEILSANSTSAIYDRFIRFLNNLKKTREKIISVDKSTENYHILMVAYISIQ